MQIMIYVGGTLVLLIFGVMLTAQATFVSMRTSAGEWVVAAIVGGSLLFLLMQTAFSVPDWRTARADARTVTAADTKLPRHWDWHFLGVRVDKIHETDQQTRAGMSGYLLPFEIVSVHFAGSADRSRLSGSDEETSRGRADFDTQVAAG